MMAITHEHNSGKAEYLKADVDFLHFFVWSDYQAITGPLNTIPVLMTKIGSADLSHQFHENWNMWCGNKEAKKDCQSIPYCYSAH